MVMFVSVVPQDNMLGGFWTALTFSYTCFKPMLPVVPKCSGDANSCYLHFIHNSNYLHFNQMYFGGYLLCCHWTFCAVHCKAEMLKVKICTGSLDHPPRNVGFEAVGDDQLRMMIRKMMMMIMRMRMVWWWFPRNVGLLGAVGESLLIICALYYSQCSNAQMHCVQTRLPVSYTAIIANFSALHWRFIKMLQLHCWTVSKHDCNVMHWGIAYKLSALLTPSCHCGNVSSCFDWM